MSKMPKIQPAEFSRRSPLALLLGDELNQLVGALNIGRALNCVRKTRQKKKAAAELSAAAQ
jgi:hypothetical protein